MSFSGMCEASKYNSNVSCWVRLASEILAEGFMDSGWVLGLLAVDLILFLVAIFRTEDSSSRRETLIVSALFFISGMPALVYQIVWQRVLFSIYGVNAESVAVVVSAFMLGLGLGSLAGGWLSARFPRWGLVLFGGAELGVAVFGLCSMAIFRWVASHTAGTSLPYTVVFSLALLIVPTMLMGATLPLLTEHLVRHSGRVGYSMATLYFVNTFGSAVACYLCASFLLREFGRSGSITMAACLNTLVGATAFLYGRSKETSVAGAASVVPEHASGKPGIPLGVAMLLAGISGFLALGFEIAWFRVFSIASSDRAPAFALLLSTYLAGVAAGSLVTEKLMEKRSAAAVVQTIGLLLVTAGGISAYLPPLVAHLMWRSVSFLASAPAFFVTAALIGSVLPSLCQVAVSADDQAGRGVSLVYVSNILGAAGGSLGIGFVLMQHFGLKQISLALGFAGVVIGGAVLIIWAGKGQKRPAWVFAAVLASLLAIPTSSRFYPLLYERLIFGNRSEATEPLAYVMENRNGVVAVTQSAAVFGNGVYDGYFNIDPLNDVNLVVRVYAFSALHPNPKRVLMIGLASGSWAQILANHPQAERLDIVEINPGYLKLIPQYPMVRSVLQNPKVHIVIDDGRRWLNAHPDERYDAIVENMSYYWRDHSSDLLSADFLEIIRRHLNPGGIFYYNTTTSDDVIATGLRAFPYGARVINFLAVSDSPFQIDLNHWMSVLRSYRIDNELVFDPAHPKANETLAAYSALLASLNQPPRQVSMESSESMRKRLGRRFLITDDNMGWEWRGGFTVPWR
jgi:spermidine synthase